MIFTFLWEGLVREKPQTNEGLGVGDLAFGLNRYQSIIPLKPGDLVGGGRLLPCCRSLVLPKDCAR